MKDGSHITWVFGTRQPTPDQTALAAGRLRVTIRDGAIAGILWGGDEVVRAIDYPIRDVDWGTLPLTDAGAEVSQDEQGFSYRRRFTAEGFSGEFSLTGCVTGELEARVRILAESDQRV